jgi:hypothetical protein
MASSTPPPDQRAGKRPISFVLDAAGVFSKPVTLVIRPEDLTRNEPTRATVHATLGREVSGWVDHFGEGLPSLTISGHTGWRGSSAFNGEQAFTDLNNLVQHDYSKARQTAIDSGADPSRVKLLFVDTLDNFAWSVVPMQFILRRSKSRPLLHQYNITLQAISTTVDNPLVLLPDRGTVTAGLTTLGGVIGTLNGFNATISGIVGKAVSFVNSALSPIAGTVKGFLSLSTSVYGQVSSIVGTIRGGSTAISNGLIDIATDISKIGVNIFRTLAAVQGLPIGIKSDLMKVSKAYNEAFCVLRNSLKPGKIYEDYSGLYGSSNCSSTTGGNPASVYAGQNVFDVMQSDVAPVRVSGGATSSVQSLARFDPVIAPMPIAEMNRHLSAVVAGVAA